jgi:dTDP-4-dehydrorhamnose 3,5-epimerase/CDP-3, 6-dideoxy-D-glycero-D-glycero-4-hexulose-5-epimerase
MIITDSEIIEGVKIITLKQFNDERGQLLKPFIKSFFLEKFNFDTKEVWFTFSKKNVVRAMHMQVAPKPSNKIIGLIQGAVTDVLLDTRKNSPTYGQTESFDLIHSEDSLTFLFIPVGVSHGYKVNQENSIVMYLGDEYHDGNSDVGFKWNSFGFNWQIENPIISERDLTLPKFTKA